MYVIFPHTEILKTFHVIYESLRDSPNDAVWFIWFVGVSVTLSDHKQFTFSESVAFMVSIVVGQFPSDVECGTLRSLGCTEKLKIQTLLINWGSRLYFWRRESRRSSKLPLKSPFLFHRFHNLHTIAHSFEDILEFPSPYEPNF